MISSSRNWDCRNGFGRHCKGVEMVNFYAAMSGLKGKFVEENKEVEFPAVIRKRKEVEVEAKKKVCGDCRTTITPLWRRGRGVDGQQFLCNACGIRCRKRSKMQLTINEESNASMNESCCSSAEEMKQRQKEKQMKMLVLLELAKNKDGEGGKMKTMMKKPLGARTKNTVNISGKKEAEEAALSLLSLSSGPF